MPSKCCAEDATEKNVGEEYSAANPAIETEKVKAGKRDILGAEHQGQNQISKNRGDGGNDESENHDRAVKREHVVVERQSLIVIGDHPVVAGPEPGAQH